MTLFDLIYGPWVLQPEVLREIRNRYEAHMAGERLSAQELEERLQARYGASLEVRTGQQGGGLGQGQDYMVQQGVAVLNISGVLAPKANLYTMICGGTSMQQATATLKAAAADRRVQSILQVVDSPGGNVVGPPEYAALVAEVAKSKPVVTVSDGLMASGGIWVGAAANQVYITGPTVSVGSIGVVATHRDASAAAARSGEVVTEVTAGKYKRIASDTGPLSADGRAYLQSQVDHIYSVFVDAVAAYRGTDAATVLEHMADGRVFIGQQAVDAGLVDGFASVDQLLAEMSTNPGKFAKRKKASPKALAVASGAQALAHGQGVGDVTAVMQGADVGADVNNPLNDGKDHAMGEQTSTAAPQQITREALERDHSVLFAALKQEFLVLGGQQERDRIVGVRAQVLPGHEALVEKLAFDGKTTPEQAAMAVNEAQRALLTAQANAHFADAPAPVKATANTGSESVLDKAAKAAQAQAYAKENGVDFVTAYKKLGFE